MTTNLFDYFEEVPEARGNAPATPAGDAGQALADASPWAARAPRIPNARFDIKLVPRRHAWREDRSSRESLERIEAEPWVESLSVGENDVELRLSDAWIETTGAALEAGGGDEVELADLARGGRYATTGR